MNNNIEAGVAQAPEKPIENEKTAEQLELERTQEIQRQQRRARSPRDYGNFAEATQDKQPEEILIDPLFGPILKEASYFSETRKD